MKVNQGGKVSHKLIQLMIIFYLAIFCGCAAGSRGKITAPTVNYPVSLSPVIRDTDGQLLKTDNLEKVGDFYQYETECILHSIC